MPVVDGLALVKEVRGKMGLVNIPIIIVSADPSKESIIEFFNAGVNDYLIKPYLKEELVARSYTHLETYYLRKILRESVKEQEVL